MYLAMIIPNNRLANVHTERTSPVESCRIYGKAMSQLRKNSFTPWRLITFLSYLKFANTT